MALNEVPHQIGQGAPAVALIQVKARLVTAADIHRVLHTVLVDAHHLERRGSAQHATRCGQTLPGTQGRIGSVEYRGAAGGGA